MKKIAFALFLLFAAAPIYAQQLTQEPTVVELKAEVAQLKMQILQLQNSLLQCQAPQVQQEVQTTQIALKAEQNAKAKSKSNVAK
jgi:hypothetical protein